MLANAIDGLIQKFEMRLAKENWGANLAKDNWGAKLHQRSEILHRALSHRGRERGREGAREGARDEAREGERGEGREKSVLLAMFSAYLQHSKVKTVCCFGMYLLFSFVNAYCPKMERPQNS